MSTEAANIVNVFIRAADRFPAQVALIHDRKTITYAALLEQVRRTAAAMEQRSIVRGDRILVAVPMSIELYTTVLALFHIGAVPVFLDAWVGPERMSECLKMVRCNVLIATRKLLLLSWFFKPLRNIGRRYSVGSLACTKSLRESANVYPGDTALITFTTGSTGPPKAANRTHGFLKAQLDALQPLLPAGQECAFTTLPIVVLLHLAMGKTTVLPPSRYSAKRPDSVRYLRAELVRNSTSTLVVSPSVMSLLTRDAAPLPELKRIITGGGPVYPDLAALMNARFPHAAVTVVFGSTEAEPISHIGAKELAGTSLEDMKNFGLPVGRPDPAATIRIIPWQPSALPLFTPEDWDKYMLPAGEAGEIVVAGDHVLRQYVNNPEAERAHKISVDGIVWHRTGDAGRIDDAGRLYFLGRCTEMIRLDDRIIFPAVLAYGLMAETGLSGAAFILLAGRLIVVAESRGDEFREPVQRFLQARGIIADEIIRFKKLPRDPRHQTKIDYAALQKHLAKKHLA